MRRETVGQKVWRLFAPTIEHYVDIYFQAEVQWQDSLVRHINPILDMPYVSTLSRHDRVLFWLDKMYLLYGSNAVHLLTFFVSRQYELSWFVEGTREAALQREFLFILLLFLETERPRPSKWLTRQLRRRFSPHLFSDTMKVASPLNASSVESLTQIQPIFSADH